MKSLPKCVVRLCPAQTNLTIEFPDAYVHRYKEYTGLERDGFTLFVRTTDQSVYDTIQLQHMMGHTFNLMLVDVNSLYTVSLEQMVRVNGYCDMLQFSIKLPDPVTWREKIMAALSYVNPFRFRRH